VSDFAGQTVELKVIDLELPPNAPLLIVDQIQFMSSVREPSTEALSVLGLLGGLLTRRRATPRGR
jgi:hypothetical protein